MKVKDKTRCLCCTIRDFAPTGCGECANVVLTDKTTMKAVLESMKNEGCFEIRTNTTNLVEDK